MLTSLQAFLRLAVLQRLGVFICALAVLLATTSTASALEPAQTKTRVWGFDFAEHNSVGLIRAASGGKHQGNRLAGAQEASGSLLAAEGAGALRPLVYGPSAGGRLAATAESLGGETLSGLAKPTELGWEAFSKQTLDAAAASGRPVIFDLTNVKNVSGVLSGTGEFANTVTGAELRYIQANWGTFQGNVSFMSGGVPVGVPW